MERSREILFLDGEEKEVNVIKYDEADIVFFRDIYNSWVTLNQNLKKVGTRGVPIPQEFIDGIVSYVKGYWKVDDLRCRFDCYDPQEKVLDKKIEIKSSLGRYDISSFAPQINWDKLIFANINPNGRNSCTIDIYDIKLDLIRNEFKEFDKTFIEYNGRRPRMSITKDLIEKEIYNEKITFSLF